MMGGWSVCPQVWWNTPEVRLENRPKIYSSQVDSRLIIIKMSRLLGLICSIKMEWEMGAVEVALSPKWDQTFTIRSRSHPTSNCCPRSSQQILLRHKIITPILMRRLVVWGWVWVWVAPIKITIWRLANSWNLTWRTSSNHSSRVTRTPPKAAYRCWLASSQTPPPITTKWRGWPSLRTISTMPRISSCSNRAVRCSSIVMVEWGGYSSRMCHKTTKLLLGEGKVKSSALRWTSSVNLLYLARPTLARRLTRFLPTV